MAFEGSLDDVAHAGREGLERGDLPIPEGRQPQPEPFSYKRWNGADGFVHAHTVLASSIKRTSGEPQYEPITLYHWHHETAVLQMVKTATLTIEDLSHVSGFQELGHYDVASKPEDLYAFIDSLSKDALESIHGVGDSHSKDGLEGTQDAPEDSEIDEIRISHIIEGLTIASSSESSEPRISITMYMVSITGNNPNGLFEGEERVWRWRKPSSQYRKECYWLQTMDGAVADGAWSGGKDLTLLVEGITQSEMGQMFSDGSMVDSPAAADPPEYASE